MLILIYGFIRQFFCFLSILFNMDIDIAITPANTGRKEIDEMSSVIPKKTNSVLVNTYIIIINKEQTKMVHRSSIYFSLVALSPFDFITGLTLIESTTTRKPKMPAMKITVSKIPAISTIALVIVTNLEFNLSLNYLLVTCRCHSPVARSTR